MLERVQENPKVQAAREHFDKQVANVSAAWANGNLQRGLRSGAYKTAAAAGAGALIALMFSAGGLLIAGGAVAVSTLVHAITERYPEMSHKNTMALTMKAMAIIQKSEEQTGEKFADLPMWQQQEVIKAAITAAAEATRKGDYRRPAGSEVIVETPAEVR